MRALGQPFIIVPLSSLTTGGLARVDQAQSSALFHIVPRSRRLARDRMLSTITTMRGHYHFDIISQRLIVTSPQAHVWLTNAAALLTPRGTPAPGRKRAVRRAGTEPAARSLGRFDAVQTLAPFSTHLHSRLWQGPVIPLRTDLVREQVKERVP